MSEIRTCEEYVLDRIARLEDELEQRKETEDMLRTRLMEFKETINLLKDVIKVRETSTKGVFNLEIDCWSTYEKSKFEKIVKALDLEFEKEEEE